VEGGHSKKNSEKKFSFLFIEQIVIVYSKKHEGLNFRLTWQTKSCLLKFLYVASQSWKWTVKK
jgi:hypothetical protein